MKIRGPRNAREWQEAVDHAHVLFLLDSARQYGLVEGGPSVKVDRSIEILKRGKSKGFIPARDCVEKILAQGR